MGQGTVLFEHDVEGGLSLVMGSVGHGYFDIVFYLRII